MRKSISNTWQPTKFRLLEYFNTYSQRLTVALAALDEIPSPYRSASTSAPSTSVLRCLELSTTTSVFIHCLLAFPKELSPSFTPDHRNLTSNTTSSPCHTQSLNTRAAPEYGREGRTNMPSNTSHGASPKLENVMVKLVFMKHLVEDSINTVRLLR